MKMDQIVVSIVLAIMSVAMFCMFKGTVTKPISHCNSQLKSVMVELDK